MYFKSLLGEALSKGEKIGSEVVEELMKSKTIHDFVTSKNFVTAVAKVIETKDEVKRVLGCRISAIFDLMDLPTRNEIKRIASKVGSLEKIFDRFVEPQSKKSRCQSKRKRKAVAKRRRMKR